MSEIGRRPLLLGLGAVLGAGLVGGGIYESVGLWRRRHTHTAYDDLLAGLGDRDDISRVGSAVLAETEGFDARETARELHKRMAHRAPPAVMAEDLAEDRVVEIQGWVLPETLTLLCALAAKAA